MTPSTQSFIQLVLGQFTEQMTDRLFLFIEEDNSLLREYRRIVARDGMGIVNSTIAQAVEKHFNLQSSDTTEKSPKSKLISSYTKLR